MRAIACAVLMVVAACGGGSYSTDSAWDGKYALAGHWMIETGTTPADAAIVGQMTLGADIATGSYTEGSTVHALTAHTFSPGSPDFSLTFGDRTVSGKLLAESNSNVFKGTLGTLAVTGVVSR